MKNLKQFLLQFSLLFLFISFYYVSSFSLSFIFIAHHISNNDYLSLDSYINEKKLEKNLKNQILEFKNFYIKNNDLQINFKNSSIVFSGELTPKFYNKLFIDLSNNLSKELSRSKIMLYFYYNSDHLKEYFNKYLINIGEYSFQEFLEYKNPKDEDIDKKSSQNDENVTKSETNEIINDEKDKNSFYSVVIKLIKKYEHTDYFFLTSPIHFKLTVLHQDIPFSVIFIFNGLKWKIHNIQLNEEIFYYK